MPNPSPQHPTRLLSACAAGEGALIRRVAISSAPEPIIHYWSRVMSTHYFDRIEGGG